MTDLKVGDPAPDFELPAAGQERVKLSEALKQGPVVLLAYVFDFTGG
jgi:peroxiredoxin